MAVTGGGYSGRIKFDVSGTSSEYTAKMLPKGLNGRLPGTANGTVSEFEMVKMALGIDDINIQRWDQLVRAVLELLEERDERILVLQELLEMKGADDE